MQNHCDTMKYDKVLAGLPVLIRAFHDHTLGMSTHKRAAQALHKTLIAVFASAQRPQDNSIRHLLLLLTCAFTEKVLYTLSICSLNGSQCYLLNWSNMLNPKRLRNTNQNGLWMLNLRSSRLESRDLAVNMSSHSSLMNRRSSSNTCHFGVRGHVRTSLFILPRRLMHS